MMACQRQQRANQIMRLRESPDRRAGERQLFFCGKAWVKICGAEQPRVRDISAVSGVSDTKGNLVMGWKIQLEWIKVMSVLQLNDMWNQGMSELCRYCRFVCIWMTFYVFNPLLAKAPLRLRYSNYISMLTCSQCWCLAGIMFMTMYTILV